MLTVKQIEKLKERGRYLDERGLYLQVLAPTNRSWLLRYEIGGRKRWMGLGSLSDFDLEEARGRARQARQLLADGIDPIDTRKAERRARDEQARKATAIPTFKEAAERYFQKHGDKWRNPKHRAQFLSTLRDYAYPKLGSLRVVDVATEDVRLAIEPIWRKIPETASRYAVGLRAC